MTKRSTDTVTSEQMEAFTRAMFTELVTQLARSLNALDISLAEIAVVHLIDQSGEMRVGEIATRLNVPMPTASRIARRLVDAGLVLRREDDQDRRARTLTLSTQGRDLVDETSRERVKFGRQKALSMNSPIALAMISALGLDRVNDTESDK